MNLQGYLQYIKSFKDLGQTIYEMDSIHQFENDYTSVIYIKNENSWKTQRATVIKVITLLMS